MPEPHWANWMELIRYTWAQDFIPNLRGEKNQNNTIVIFRFIFLSSSLVSYLGEYKLTIVEDLTFT